MTVVMFFFARYWMTSPSWTPAPRVAASWLSAESHLAGVNEGWIVMFFMLWVQTLL